MPAGRAHIFFCLEEALEQIPVADLNSGASPFYIDVADLHDRGPRRRAFLKQAGQRAYRRDAPWRDAALTALETLAYAASPKTFILAKFGDVGATTGTKLVYRVGVTHRLSGRRLTEVRRKRNRRGENKATTVH